MLFSTLFGANTYFVAPVPAAVTAAAEGTSLDGTTVVLGNDTLGADGAAALTKNREIGMNGFSIDLQDFQTLPSIVQMRLSSMGVILLDQTFGGSATFNAGSLDVVLGVNTTRTTAADYQAFDTAGNIGSVSPTAVGVTDVAGNAVVVSNDRILFQVAGGVGNFWLRINAGVLEFVTVATNTVLATVDLNAGTGDAEFNSLTQRDTVLLHSAVALADGAGVGLGTLLTAPAAGNPTKWLPVDDNGTTRFIPAW